MRANLDISGDPKGVVFEPFWSEILTIMGHYGCGKWYVLAFFGQFPSSALLLLIQTFFCLLLQHAGQKPKHFIVLPRSITNYGKRSRKKKKKKKQTRKNVFFF